MSVAGGGGWRTGPVGVAHRQRGGIDALVRLGSEEAALLVRFCRFTGSSGRCWRMLLLTDGRLRVFARAALPRDKSAGQSRAGPARVWVQGCNRRGLPGKNQNPGGADERDLFIDAPAAVSERISMTLISVEAPPPKERCCSGAPGGSRPGCVIFVGRPHLSLTGVSSHKLVQKFGPSPTRRRQNICV